VSGLTLETSQQILNALLEAQLSGSLGGIQSVSIAGRTVTYSTAADLMKLINYWSAIVARFQRSTAGASRYAVPNFRGH
jgi:hypothetical protein